MQWAAVTTLVAETRVPPQNWFCEASVICIMNGYEVVVVVVPPTMGWGAATAVGAPNNAVAAAAAGARGTPGGFLARGRPNISESPQGCRGGGARVWGSTRGSRDRPPYARRAACS